MYRATVDYGPANQWTEFKDSTSNKSAQGIIKKYFVPYLITLKKPTKITLKELGYSKDITRPNGVKYMNLGLTDNNTQERIFLSDGTIILHHILSTNNFRQVIDINGPKGPNSLGRDVFEVGFDMRAEAPIVTMAGMYERSDETGEIEPRKMEDLITSCKSTGVPCGALIQQNSWKIPNNYPLKI